MERIRILNPHIANQIAAGEVVERPASIVKELVENAIDAGSSAISVEISGGGMDMIRVVDNGSGIPAEDAVLAFSRHATSKISSGEDLEQIATLGFRGEALASIAAVAHVTLRTRTAEESVGTLIRIDGGTVQENAPVGCTQGTSIEVSDLFYNIPARKKFLKSARSEASAIGDYMARLILSMPSVAFKYTQNEKILYQSAGDGVLKNAIYCVYGADALEQVLPVHYDDAYVQLSGFVGKDTLSRPNRNAQSFFLNTRYIKSQRLSFALQNAFDTRMMSGRFPFVVLHMRLALQEVDVNVHPQKLDVRFRDEQRIARAVTHAIRAALGPGSVPLATQNEHFGQQTEKIVGETLPKNEDAREVSAAFDHSAAAALNRSAPLAGSVKLREGSERMLPVSPAEFSRMADALTKPSFERGVVQAEAERLFGVQKPENTREEGSQPERTAQIPEYRVGKPVVSKPFTEETPLQTEVNFGAQAHVTIGLLFSCYWLVQQGDDVFFIDQHAAHERKLYESLMQSGIAAHSQLLLVPEILKLAPVEYDTLMENLPYFEELGFDIAEFGAFTVSVRAVPHIIGQPQTQAFLHEALAALLAGTRTSAAQLKRDTLIQFACKHAIKAGARISEMEIETLLTECASGGIPFTCPHGRPIMVRMRKLDFEKMFKRVL